MFAFIRKSTPWFVIIQIVFVICLACGSKDPVEVNKNPGPTCVAASDSIVGWWPLDQLGTTAEELVAGNHGDYNSNPSEAEGKVAGALQFDGVDDVVEVGDPGANWTYDITGSFTLEAWIKRETDQTGQQTITGKSFAYSISINNGRVLGYIQNVVTLVGTSLVPVGGWHHIAVTYDQTAQIFRVFLDGEVESTLATGGQAVPVNNFPFNIGGFFSSGGGVSEQYFDGIVDEVSVYNTALTTSEIRDIYNRGSLGKCKQ